MPITQTVEIPANRRLSIDVPIDVPTGKVILTFTPVAKTDTIELINATTTEVLTVGAEILNEHLDAFKALAK